LSEQNKAVEYRQILTKAICGRGRKFSQTRHQLQPPENVDTILGAWIINHNYKTQKIGEAVEVSGSYDINIWYSTKGNTKTDVMKETVSYTEHVPLSYYDRNVLNDEAVEVRGSISQAPNCVEASISSSNNSVEVKIEKEFVVELVGETKICVASHPLEMAEIEDKKCISGYDEEQDFDDLDPDLVVDDLED